jgi:nicotinate-nucleotide adenylyltransferase
VPDSAGGICGAVAFVLGALVVILMRLPNAGLWAAFAVAAAFACALNVVVSRPRPVAATAVGPVVGVFGGSFDPFHLGHRAICEATLAVVQRLLVVVSARPPHKQGARELSAFHHRVAMTRIGIEGLPRTEVLELENRREGPSYTIDTLEALGRLFPPGSRFRLVLGADSFQDFPTWKDWEGILEKADLIVVGRRATTSSRPRVRGRNAPVERLDVALNEASSTAVRARVIAGSPGPMVSAAVAASSATTASTARESIGSPATAARGAGLRGLGEADRVQNPSRARLAASLARPAGARSRFEQSLVARVRRGPAGVRGEIKKRCLTSGGQVGTSSRLHPPGRREIAIQVGARRGAP